MFTGTVESVERDGLVAHVRTDAGQRIHVIGTPSEAGATTVDRTFTTGVRYEFHPLNSSSPYQDNICTRTHAIDAAAPTGSSAAPASAAPSATGDCSGLTTAAYAAAGIRLPRHTQAQYDAGPLVPAGQPLMPGDLVLYGTPDKVRQVGLYLGAGKMVHAPTYDKPVQISSYRWGGDDYLAAARPANATGAVAAAAP
jgi:cell wall-associated NlpC family hydrolase